MKSLDENDIIRFKSLINLLDDEDNSIYSSVKSYLIQAGEEALPFLEDCLEASDPLVKSRVQEIYESITADSFKEQMRNFCLRFKDDVDLEEGALIIAKYGYPRVDMRIYSDLLNFYAAEFQGRFDPSDAPEDIAVKISTYLSREKGFSGNEVDYYNCENHYLNKIMETKRGVPIALSVVYLLVLKRLNLPVYGIGMPGHFIIRYDFGPKSLYADPSSGGAILSLEACKKISSQLGYDYRSEYLDPVTNRQILERMLRNLVLVFEKQNQSGKVQAMIQCIDILNMNV